MSEEITLKPNGLISALQLNYPKYNFIKALKREPLTIDSEYILKIDKIRDSASTYLITFENKRFYGKFFFRGVFSKNVNSIDRFKSIDSLSLKEAQASFFIPSLKILRSYSFWYFLTMFLIPLISCFLLMNFLPAIASPSLFITDQCPLECVSNFSNVSFMSILPSCMIILSLVASFIFLSLLKKVKSYPDFRSLMITILLFAGVYLLIANSFLPIYLKQEKVLKHLFYSQFDSDYFKRELAPGLGKAYLKKKKGPE